MTYKSGFDILAGARYSCPFDNVRSVSAAAYQYSYPNGTGLYPRL